MNFKKKIIFGILYSLGVLAFSFVMGGSINTMIHNNFKFEFKGDLFISMNTLYISLAIAVVFFIIPLYYIARKYISNNGASVDKVTKSKSNLYGSSRFLQKKELDKIFPLAFLSQCNYKAGFLVNSRFERNSIAGNLSYDRHTLITGTTGSGKTTYLFEPSLQFIAKSTDKPSLVIGDPKGELYEKESGVFKENGYKVLKLDLRNPEHSLRFNPLEIIYDEYHKQLNEYKKIIQHDEIFSDYIKTHEFEADFIDNKDTNYWFEYDGIAYEDIELVNNAVERTRRGIISELKDKTKQITACIVPKEGKEQPVWTEGSRSLIDSVMWCMLEDSEVPELGLTKEKFTLNQISYILSADEDYLMDFINNRPSTSTGKNLGSQYSNNKAESMRDSFKSMAITFLNKLNGLEYLLGENEFDFTTFTSQPTVIFLIIPDESSSRYSVATMFITLLYSYLIKEASLTNNVLKRKVFFLLDEFANLPPFEEISKWLSISRSRGILFFLVIQSLGQLNNIYGRDVTSTIQTQCQLHIYLGTSDKETQEYYQYLLGSETVRQNSISAKPVIGEATSSSENLTGKPLVRTDELGRIKRGEAYIKAFQEHPAKTSLIPIFYPDLPEYKGCKEEFLTTKPVSMAFKPKTFDIESLSYNIKDRYELFNEKKGVKDKPSKKTETKVSVREELEALVVALDTKKEIILEAFDNKKYSLVISNLRELKKNGEIAECDDIITRIKNLKK